MSSTAFPQGKQNSTATAILGWNGVLQYARSGSPPPPQRVVKTDAEWRAVLTPDQYAVARAKGTERAHSSKMCSLFTAGRYACLCCKTELFDSSTKFESGTGWPSFTQSVAPNVVGYHEDRAYGMSRVEVVCAVCDAHLGHVFEDGPPPSGLRYCINAISLIKIEG